MDDTYDDEQCDSVYANDPVSEFLNVTENLRQQTLDQLLEEDKRAGALKDDPISWYHGKIPREAAESILKEGDFFYRLICFNFCSCIFVTFVNS